jgi:hypothetical protein
MTDAGSRGSGKNERGLLLARRRDTKAANQLWVGNGLAQGWPTTGRRRMALSVLLLNRPGRALLVLSSWLREVEEKKYVS